MNDSAFKTKVTRRKFLAAAGAAIAMPTIIPLSALGRDGKTAPSERVTVGVVGWGWQGPDDTRACLPLPNCQVVAACDLDTDHLKDALDTMNGFYHNKDCKGYHDFREMMARPDIDAVILAVPDHWHALVAIEAANHKKDIYGEKPLAKTITEQQAIVHAVERNNRIWQTGSWQRSVANFHKAAEIVRNGYIGEITHVEVGLPSGHADFMKTGQYTTPSPPPPELDYETWIGPAKMMPYIRARIHRNWRWNYNTGGGQLMDWIGHHCDIAHWGMDADNSGPYEVEGHGDFPPEDAVWNTCTKYRIELKYPKNITMTIAGGYPDIRSGTKWIGTEGWVWVDRSGFEGSKPEWNDYKELPEEMRKVKLYSSSNHRKNFIDCVKSRQPTITPVQTAHHSAIPGHLGLISMLVGRKLRWDVASERILNDHEATRLMGRPYRAPWKLPGNGPTHLALSPKQMAEKARGNFTGISD
jgi:predicted dehydrogenase